MVKNWTVQYFDSLTARIERSRAVL